MAVRFQFADQLKARFTCSSGNKNLHFVLQSSEMGLKVLRQNAAIGFHPERFEMHALLPCKAVDVQTPLIEIIVLPFLSDCMGFTAPDPQ